MKGILIPTVLLAALLLPGCTTEQVYATGQAWQRDQCNQLPDKAEADRCMGKSGATYDSYKRAREAAEK